SASFAIPQSGTSVWTGRQLILFGRREITALDARGAIPTSSSRSTPPRRTTRPRAPGECCRRRPAPAPCRATRLCGPASRAGLRSVPLRRLHAGHEHVARAAEADQPGDRLLDGTRGDRLGWRLLW